MHRFLLTLFLCLPLHVQATKIPHNGTRSIVLGIGTALLDIQYFAHPRVVGLKPEENRYISAQRLQRVKKVFGSGQQRPAGIILNTLNLARQLTACSSQRPYTFQFLGNLGKGHTPFIVSLKNANITWRGTVCDEETGTCFVFSHRDTRSFLVHLGCGHKINLQKIQNDLAQPNIHLGILDGFLLTYDLPFPKENLIDSICARIPKEKLFLLLPCKERITPSYRPLLQEAVKRFGHTTGNASEYTTLFERSDATLLYHLPCFAKEHGVTLCMTDGQRSSYTFTPHTTYVHNVKPINTVQNTNGAGDAYAAGFVSGHLLGSTPDKCGELGVQAAREVLLGQRAFLQ